MGYAPHERCCALRLDANVVDIKVNAAAIHKAKGLNTKDKAAVILDVQGVNAAVRAAKRRRQE